MHLIRDGHMGSRKDWAMRTLYLWVVVRRTKAGASLYPGCKEGLQGQGKVLSLGKLLPS